MRGANVVRRRSGTNPGETGATGAVNGGQADGGGSGLLAEGPPRVMVLGMPAPAGQDADLRSNPSSPQWTSPGYAPAPGSPGRPGLRGRRVCRGSVTGGRAGRPVAGQHGPCHPAERPGAARSRFALVNWRVRWRLAAVIAVPTLTAAVLGALTINSDVNQWEATGRVQHLAQLNGDVVKFSQALEDELNLSAAFAATRPDNGAYVADLKKAQNTTDSAANAVLNDSSGVTDGRRVPAGHRAGPQRGPGEHQRPGERPHRRHQVAVPRVADRPGLQRQPHHAREHVQRRHRYRRQRRRPAGQRHHAGRPAAEREPGGGAAGHPVRRARLAPGDAPLGGPHHPPAGPRAGGRRPGRLQRLDRHGRAAELQQHRQRRPGGRRGLERDPGRADGHHHAERPAPHPAEAGELERGHDAHHRGHPEGGQPADRRPSPAGPTRCGPTPPRTCWSPAS